MGGKGLEYAGGTAAALGGVAATAFGMPEIGIPLLLGGIGMDTGQAFGGNKGGLMGGLAGAGVGMGAEGLGAGAMGIPTLFGSGAAGAGSAVDAAASGAAAAAPATSAASAAPGVLTQLPSTSGTLAQAGPAVEQQVGQEAQAEIADAAAKGGTSWKDLGLEGLKAGGPTVASLLTGGSGGGAQSTQQPAPPARPPQPVQPAQSQGPATASTVVPAPNPMGALADYHQFLTGISGSMG